MKCKKCNNIMYVEVNGQGHKKYVCVNCDYSFNYMTDSFEFKPRMVNPDEYNNKKLINMVTKGEIGLNQIPLPERKIIKNELKNN